MRAQKSLNLDVFNAINFLLYMHQISKQTNDLSLSMEVESIFKKLENEEISSEGAIFLGQKAFDRLS